MGFFDKIKKAFSAEKKEEEKQEIIEETVDETPSDESAPAESKETAAEEAQTTPETTAEEVTETADLTDNAEMEKLAGVEEALEEEPEEILTEETQEVVVEAPEEESSVVTPLAEPTDTQVSEEIEESKEEQVQEKYEKGLEKTRKTFGQRLNELFANFRSVDEDFFEELEETLIGADVGFDTSLKITEALRQEVKLRNVKKPAQVQNTIIEKMVDLYEEAGINENNAINLQPNGLTVILFVGVNGVGMAISSQSSGTYFLSTSTIGAAGVVSNWRAASGKPSATGNMTASGFAGRCLRARSVATALLLRASQAR